MKKLIIILCMLIGMIGIQAQVAITQSGNSVKFVNTTNATTTYLTGIDIVNINGNNLTFQRSGGSSESGYVRVNFTDITDKMGKSTPALYVDNLMTLGYFDPGVVVTNLIVDLSAETGTGGAYLKITTSSGVKDSVKLVESGSIDIAQTDVNTMTFTVPVVDTSKFVRLGDSVLVSKDAFNATTFNNAAGAVSKDAFRDEIILYSKIASAETITGAKEMTGANQFYGAITTISDTTVLSKDVQYVILADGTSHNMMLTLPAASTCLGKIIKIKCINSSNEVKIITAGGDIDATAGGTGFTMTIWDGREFMSNGTNWYIISKF